MITAVRVGTTSATIRMDISSVGTTGTRERITTGAREMASIEAEITSTEAEITSTGAEMSTEFETRSTEARETVTTEAREIRITEETCIW